MPDLASAPALTLDVERATAAWPCCGAAAGWWRTGRGSESRGFRRQKQAHFRGAFLAFLGARRIVAAC